MIREMRKKLAKQKRQIVMQPEELRLHIDNRCAVEKDEAFHRGQAQMLCLILAFLHIDKRHTEKYLRTWLGAFNDFALSVNGYGDGGLAELNKILMNECNFDVEKEYRSLMQAKGGNTGNANRSK